MIDTPMIEALSRFLDVDVARHKLITSNLANIDTPGYRTRDLDFRAELARVSWRRSWRAKRAQLMRALSLCSGLRPGGAAGCGD